MSIKLGSCATCVFFKTAMWPQECRANPPQVVVHDGKIKSVWPSVDADDSCKEWTSAIRGGQKKTLQEIINEAE